MAPADDISHGPVSLGGMSPRPLCAVAAVLLGSFFTNFDTALITFGIADLRGAFSLTFDEGAWVRTASVGAQIFVAPAIAWLATAFGLRRVLAIPSLIYAIVCFSIPFARNYPILMTLSILHGLLLGTFVPATFMIIFRHLPEKWWLWAITIYAARVGFTLDTSPSVLGFYVDNLQWEWLYWEGALIAPLMALLVFLGTPPTAIDRDLAQTADWGGMLLLGTSLSMIYAGLDQGDRLNWLQSGVVVGLLLAGAVLFVAFLINEAVVRQPWAHIGVLFNRNIGICLTIVLLYTLTSVSNSTLVPTFLATVASLRPEQSGELMLWYGAVPTLAWTPICVVLLRHFDARLVLLSGLAAFAAASLMGTGLTYEWSLADFVAITVLQSVGQVFTLTAAIITMVSNLDRSRATAFAAYIQIMRVCGVEIGVALIGTWLRVREQIHSNYLGLHVADSAANVAALLNSLANNFMRNGPGVAHDRALQLLSDTIAREANVLAFIDGFWLCLWLAVAGLLLVGLLTRAPEGPFTPTAFGFVVLLRRGLRRSAIN